MREQPGDSLPETFWDVARLLRHASRESLAAWDIAPSHARALGVLIREGDQRLSDLSERLRIAPRSTTEVVDGLQERGLVERRADPADRRATIVSVTRAGHRVGAAVQADRAATGDRVFATLSETDRAHLARILRKLRAAKGDT